jgi:outer membrane protein OmpA-like peptidoglycan-associated protein
MRLGPRDHLAARVSASCCSIDGSTASRPIAPNQNPDGTDNADGRQRNRRVEVVINTCS